MKIEAVISVIMECMVFNQNALYKIYHYYEVGYTIYIYSLPRIYTIYEVGYTVLRPYLQVRMVYFLKRLILMDIKMKV